MDNRESEFSAYSNSIEFIVNILWPLHSRPHSLGKFTNVSQVNGSESVSMLAVGCLAIGQRDDHNNIWLSCEE